MATPSLLKIKGKELHCQLAVMTSAKVKAEAKGQAEDKGLDKARAKAKQREVNPLEDTLQGDQLPKAPGEDTHEVTFKNDS
jgi:hypothetical protein